ncbi:MAG: sugar ABC transporter ATP-binding protein [Hespellia sp.]|nr:sugar ABC transporter ATP-binding protein [Hespellia sp.]
MSSVLEMKGIKKSFSNVEVLHGVDFSLEKGEIRALLGANGAGKSTLMKILCGIYSATDGEIHLEGKPVSITQPSTASELGIAIVHQELSIIPTLTVLQNFFLGREELSHGILKEKEMRKQYREICTEFEFDIDPDIQARKLSVAKQQMIEIMKILSLDAKIIVLDEPTTSLTDDEKKNLFGLIRQLKEREKTIIYISHVLEEIFLLADQATIMRNGEMVGTWPVKELTIPLISEYMTGNKIEHGQRGSTVQENMPPVLEVKNLCNQSVHDVTFSVKPGEVLGLAGLMGAGRSEIVRALFGADSKTAGSIQIAGKTVRIRTPRDAIRSGIGLIPEDRKTEGLILKHEIFKNMSMVQLKKLKKHSLLHEKTEKQFAKQAVEKLSIKLNKVTDQVGNLSGGNQQKVVVSKWISEDFKVLIFDEPTKGIDIGAKEDIFQIVDDFAKMGIGIIFISSDLEEVIRVADRMLIIRDGQVIEEMENKDVSQKDIMESILRGGKKVG